MRTLCRLLGDLFSFEMLFTLFISAGLYKSSSFLAPINEKLDLTVAMAAAGMYVGFLLFLVQGGLLRRRTVAYLLIYMLYVSYALISYLSIYDSPDAGLKTKKLCVMVTWALCGPMFVINTDARISRFLRLLVIVAISAGMSATIQQLRGGALTFTGPFETMLYQSLGRVTGMGIAVLTVFAAFEKDSAKRTLYAVTTGILVLPLILAAARQAILGLVVVGIFLCYAWGKSKGWARLPFRTFLLIGVIGTVAVGARAILFSSGQSHSAEERILTLTNPSEFQRTSRLKQWQVGLRLWSEKPLLGIGFGNFRRASTLRRYRQPHNLFIEHLCELGLVGFLLMLVLLGVPAWHVLRPFMLDNAIGVSITSLFLFTLTCAMFSGDITDNRLIFTFAALIITYTAVREEHERVRATGPQPGERPTARMNGVV